MQGVDSADAVTIALRRCGTHRRATVVIDYARAPDDTDMVVEVDWLITTEEGHREGSVAKQPASGFSVIDIVIRILLLWHQLFAFVDHLVFG